MNHNLGIILIFIACAIEISVCKKFDNYTLYRGVPLDYEQFQFLNNLSNTFHVNYWKYPGRLNMSTDFLVPPRYKDEFLRTAAQHKLQLVTLIKDVQTEFDKQTVKHYIRRRTESFDWNSFYRLDDIYRWMKDLVEAHSSQMKVFSIGQTYEKREILAAKILLKPSTNKPVVIVEGGIHAREWISPAVVTYMLRKILNAERSKHESVKSVALKYEWYFVPVLNGDGYEYSHTNNRLWRKNRRGYGTDINRNFDIGFGTEGISFEEKSEIYCGPKAFSEPESKAMSDFVRKKSKRLLFYFSFHSYGQHIIIPYAHTTQHLENFDEMKEIADKAKEKISRRYGTNYTTGTAYDTVGYTTSGVSACWVKKTFQVPYVAVFELRDAGKYGFALPTAQILPTCRETLDGLVSILTDKKTLKQIENATESSVSRSEQEYKRYSFVFLLLLLNIVVLITVS